MKPVTVQTPAGPLFLRLSPSVPVHAAMIRDFAGNGYEPGTWQFLRDTVKPGMRCVDVGGHIGVMTGLLSLLVGKEGYVTAFEPHPHNRTLLLRTVRDNGFTNVKVKKQAVGKDCGIARLHWNADNDGGHAIYDVGKMPTNEKSRAKPKSTILEQCALDDVMDKPVDVIKMDIEGAEYHALQGAERILREDRPVVVAEVNAPGLRAMGTCENDWRTWMRSLGYREVALLDTGAVPIEADQTCSAVQMQDGKQVIPVWNIAFIPTTPRGQQTSDPALATQTSFGQSSPQAPSSPSAPLRGSSAPA